MDAVGKSGEDAGCAWLEARGHRVLERNWRMGHLEVDLIAENKKEIVFAEVKARTSTFGDIKPEEFVDENKKRRMVAAGNAYAKFHKAEKILRFDIIGVLVNPETGEVTYSNHLENAFQPQARTVSSGSHSGAWKWLHRNKTIGNKR